MNSPDQPAREGPTSDGPSGSTPPERRLIDGAFAQVPAVGDPDLPPTDLVPGYELAREVHRGGQGAVYLAIQKTTRRRVAVKVLHGGSAQGSRGRARFEREVQILGQLVHPHIVRLHDSGVTSAGAWFYVMDYISGESLDQFIASSRTRPMETTLRLFATICEASTRRTSRASSTATSSRRTSG